MVSTETKALASLMKRCKQEPAPLVFQVEALGAPRPRMSPFADSFEVRPASVG